MSKLSHELSTANCLFIYRGLAPTSRSIQTPSSHVVLTSVSGVQSEYNKPRKEHRYHNGTSTSAEYQVAVSGDSRFHGIVTTPQQLLDAVEKGVRHIEIQDHLDMTTVRPQSLEWADMLEPWAATWSIRVCHAVARLCEITFRLRKHH